MDYEFGVLKLLCRRSSIMVLQSDSLLIALIGDWNKFYIQPDWMATNVFVEEEIEIGVNGQGSDLTVSYRKNGVIISPSQNKIIFSIMNTDNETKLNLCRYLNNFIEKAYTPKLYAYGLNCCFTDENSYKFASIIDSISDTKMFIDNGYEIISTKISRTIKKNDRVLNVDFNIDNNGLKVHFNEHHESENDKPKFDLEYVNFFISECESILSSLDYEIEVLE